MTFERELWRTGQRLVCGIDEVGRGPLAGPVVAAAVVLPQEAAGHSLEGVTDSKLLSERERFEAFLSILETAAEVATCRVEAFAIDRINILNAALEAMRGAVLRLQSKPHHLLVDGNRPLSMDLPETTIVKGDRKSRSIAAASIVAKVVRDAEMRRLDNLAPCYGFKQNKGYPTAFHREAVLRHGPSPFHRLSFLRFYREPSLPFA